MRLSKKNLIKEFGILAEEAELVLLLVRYAGDPYRPSETHRLESLIYSTPCLEKTEEYARRCHTSPFNSWMWRKTMAMHAIDTLVDGFGLEGGKLRGKEFSYVNFGESYTPTIIWSTEAKTPYIGCWGDRA